MLYVQLKGSGEPRTRSNACLLNMYNIYIYAYDCNCKIVIGGAMSYMVVVRWESIVTAAKTIIIPKDNTPPWVVVLTRRTNAKRCWSAESLVYKYFASKSRIRRNVLLCGVVLFINYLQVNFLWTFYLHLSRARNSDSRPSIIRSLFFQINSHGL